MLDLLLQFSVELFKSVMMFLNSKISSVFVFNSFSSSVQLLMFFFGFLISFTCISVFSCNSCNFTWLEVSLPVSLQTGCGHWGVTVVQVLSPLWLCDTQTVALQAPLFFTIFQSLLKFMFIESAVLSNHLILWWPLIYLSMKVFSSELALHTRWPKYWRFRVLAVRFFFGVSEKLHLEHYF